MVANVPFTPESEGTFPFAVSSGGQVSAHPPVQVVMVLESVVRWYRVSPLRLVRTTPIPAMDRVPTTGPPVDTGGDALGLGDGDGDGDAEGGALLADGGGAALGDDFAHAARRIIPATPARRNPALREFVIIAASFVRCVARFYERGRTAVGGRNRFATTEPFNPPARAARIREVAWHASPLSVGEGIRGRGPCAPGE